MHGMDMQGTSNKIMENEAYACTCIHIWACACSMSQWEHKRDNHSSYTRPACDSSVCFSPFVPSW